MEDHDYFKILEIPLSFRPDLSLLKKNYYRLSRQYHPDYFTSGSDEDKANALVMSGIVNKAYKILSDDAERIKYILSIYRMLDDAESTLMDQTFLLEMMEINEYLFDLDTDFSIQKFDHINKMVTYLESSLKSSVEKEIDDFENQQDSNKSLEKIKEYYLKSKYLLRIHEKMATFADHLKM